MEPTTTTNSDGPASRTKWVVGTDGSEQAFDALRWAAAHARDRDVSVDLVAAWQYPYTSMVPMTGDVFPAWDFNPKELAETELATAAARASSELGIEVETHQGLGTAAHVLLEASENAELLIVGQRGRGGFARLLLGSVSHQVACHATCPTVIVPGPTRKTTVDRVVVGVDGSDHSLDALRWTFEFVPATTEIRVVSTWESPYASEIGLGFETLADIRSAAQAQIRDAVLDLEKDLGQEGRTELIFTVGHPGTRIVEFGADADLVVVGARGRSGIAAALIGSTATWVAHHPPCPTVIVAQQEDQDQHEANV